MLLQNARVGTRFSPAHEITLPRHPGTFAVSCTYYWRNPLNGRTLLLADATQSIPGIHAALDVRDFLTMMRIAEALCGPRPTAEPCPSCAAGIPGECMADGWHYQGAQSR